MRNGTVQKLVHLSTQTDVSSASIVRDHNLHGCRNIETDEDGETDFDQDSVDGLGFDSLSEGDSVKFTVDDTEPKQATSVDKTK